MRVVARVTNAKGIRAALREVDEATRRAAVGALEDGADEIASRAKELILDPPKTGRVYSGGKGFGTHQASAPGEAPASDTGNLVGLIGVDRVDVTRLRVAIFSSAKYSAALEFGTSKMAPRPFLRRALREMGSRIIGHFKARGINVR
jgi:HK97 gp10 family phage protein